MKGCLTILSGFLFGVIAYVLFQAEIENARRFAGLDSSNASRIIHGEMMKSVSEWNKNNPSNPRQIPYTIDDPNLLRIAERAITRSSEISQMSQFMINLKASIVAVVGFLFGSLGYMIICFIVVITTKPLDSILDSAWGNFSRYLLMPFFTLATIGALLWGAVAQVFISIIIGSPDVSYSVSNTQNQASDSKIHQEATPNIPKAYSDSEMQARVLAADRARQSDTSNATVKASDSKIHQEATPNIPKAYSDSEMQARVLAADRARQSDTSNATVKASDAVWVVNLPSGDTLNVRSGPGVSFPIVAKLPPETKVQSSGELQMNGATEWVKILLPGDGQVGWAVKGFLTKSQKANFPEKQSLQEGRNLQSPNEAKINFKCPNCAKLIEVEIARNNVDIGGSEVIGSQNYPAQVMRCPACSSMIHIADESELRRPENQSPRTISGSDGSRYWRYPNGLLKVLY